MGVRLLDGAEGGHNTDQREKTWWNLTDRISDNTKWYAGLYEWRGNFEWNRD